MTLFLYGPLFIGLWLAWKTWSLPFLSKPVRLLGCALWIAVSQSFSLQHHFFGSLAGPDIPAPVLVVLNTLFAAMLLAFAGMAVWELAALIAKAVRCIFCRKKQPEEARAADQDAPLSPSRRRFLAMTSASGLGVLLPASAAASAAGVRTALAKPELKAWDAYLPGLPAAMDGLRIVQLTDLHIGPLWSVSDASYIVNMVNQAKPDLICITGDLADGEPEWRCADNVPRVKAAQQFADLKSRFGTFACTGNHEYISNYTAWMSVWEACGITFLHNAFVPLAVQPGATLLLGGLDDPRAPKASGSDVFASAPKGPDTFRLLMDHRPVRAALNARRGVQLQLSGHTHGGQIRGFDAVVARANKGFVRGWYRVGDMSMYVSAGTSQWSGFAVRLGVPPEAALITLHAGRTKIVQQQP